MSNPRSTTRFSPQSINRDNKPATDVTWSKDAPTTPARSTGLFAKEEKPYTVGNELSGVILRAQNAA